MSALGRHIFFVSRKLTLKEVFDSMYAPKWFSAGSYPKKAHNSFFFNSLMA